MLDQDFFSSKQESSAGRPVQRIITRSAFGDPVDIWGLQRTHEVLRPEVDFATYHLYYTGKGVDIYLIDSGVNKDHVEFLDIDPDKTRVTCLFDPFGTEGVDELGHGTHAASLICGRLVGFATQSQLYNLKVFRKDRQAQLDLILEALDEVLKHHQEKTEARPSVLNISWNIKKNARLDKKIRELINAGVVCVCAAGNEAVDVMDLSPAHLDTVITVAASDDSDRFCNESNFGAAIDIIAPGADIEGAHPTDKRTYFKLSGTSSSTAYVSGVLASYLEASPKTDALQAKTFLWETSTKDNISFDHLPKTHGTPNRLLFNQMQKLEPRWLESNNTLVGLFVWGKEVKTQVKGMSRTDSEVTYSLVQGSLPKGVQLKPNGEIVGTLGDYDPASGDKTQYFNFVVQAEDENGVSQMLFYLVATFEDEIAKEDFQDAYLVELAKVGSSGSCSA